MEVGDRWARSSDEKQEEDTREDRRRSRIRGDVG
jgi:hypothetical protein